MSTYTGTVPLLFAVAAGRSAELLALLPITLTDVPGELLAEGHPRIRFRYVKVVAEDGTDTMTVAARPSSGDGEAWEIYLVQADTVEAVEHSATRALKTAIEDAAAQVQPSGAGKYHVLGPWTPAGFKAVAPAGAVAAARFSWLGWWRGGCDPDVQFDLTDDDLEDPTPVVE
jgi:hypothetical protein